MVRATSDGLAPRGQRDDSIISRGRTPRIGQGIYDLQLGKVLAMPLSRPMPSVSLGAAELRIRDDAGIYRAFYYMSSPRGILVFHAFMKKSQTTPTRELQLGKRRLKEILHEEV